MRLSSISAVLLVCVASLASCLTDGTEYSEFKAIGNAGWGKDRALHFDLPDSLAAGMCDIKLGIRHDNYYPYRNLWLTVDYVAGGKVAATDTVDVELSDKFGNWHGSGLGKLLQYEVVLRRNVAVGTYDAVILNHDMRCDTVAGISDIGIILVDSHKNDRLE